MADEGSGIKRLEPSGAMAVVSRLATPLIDVLTIVAYFLALPWFVGRMGAKDIWNLPLVIGCYLLMCWGFWVCKGLKRAPQAAVSAEPEKTQDKEPGEGQGCALGLSVPFAIFVAVMAIEGSGLLDSANGSAIDDVSGKGGVLVTLAVVGGFIGLLLFPLVLLIRRTAVVEYGTVSHLLYRLLGVGGVNLMILVSTAYWMSQLAGAEPMDIAIGGKILVFVCVYIVFLMFYAAPRLALIEFEPGQWSYLSFALMLGVFVWRLMA